MVMGNLTCLTHGATIVYPGEGVLTARAVLAGRAGRALHRAPGVPTMFIAELEHRAAPSSTSPACAPASWPDPVSDRSDETGPDAIWAPHGMTIAYGDRDLAGELPELRRHAAQEAASAPSGLVQPHLEVKIVPATGATVLHRPVRRALHARLLGDARLLGGSVRTNGESVDADGWMHTGDLATMDAGATRNIVGRLEGHGEPRRRKSTRAKSRVPLPAPGHLACR